MDASGGWPDTGTEPDDALLARIGQGDRVAFATFAARHLDRVHAVAERMTGNRADAEEIAQDTMLKVWAKAAAWRGKGSGGTAKATTWLYRIAVNAATDRLRKARPLNIDDVPEPADERPGADTLMEREATRLRVRAAMDELPERQRAALVLSHFEQMSNPDIASVLDVSVEAVESLLGRARRALRASLLPEKAELLGGSLQ